MGGGGESKEGDQEEGREAQFVDLLARCVRASQLGSNDLSLVVLREPLVQRSAAAMVSMVRVLQERAVDSEHAALFASPEPLCRRRADDANLAVSMCVVCGLKPVTRMGRRTGCCTHACAQKLDAAGDGGGETDSDSDLNLYE